MTLRPSMAATVTAVLVGLAVLVPLFGVFGGTGWWFRLATAVVAAAAVTTAVETTRPERTLPLLSLATAAGAILWTLVVIRGSAFQACGAL